MEDAFGNTLSEGDTIVYYSGNQGALVKTRIVRFIHGTLKKYGKPVGKGITGIETPNGIIRNPKVTMKVD